MRTINVCPSLLTEGFSDYSPKAIKTLFGGVRTTCHLDFAFDTGDVGSGYDSSMDLDNETEDYVASTRNLSISGAQEKYPGILDRGKIRIAGEGERKIKTLLKYKLFSSQSKSYLLACYEA